jgi:hypothetical protein
MNNVSDEINQDDVYCESHRRGAVRSLSEALGLAPLHEPNI